MAAASRTQFRTGAGWSSRPVLQGGDKALRVVDAEVSDVTERMRRPGPDGTIAEIEIGHYEVIVPEIDDHVVGRGGARGQIGRGWEEREAP